MSYLKSIGLMLACSFFLLSPSPLSAQAPGKTEKTLKEGMVWSIEYIRSKPGKSEEYRNYLANYYFEVMTAAKQEGIIADFKILSSMPGNDSDWDLMILTAVNKFSDLDEIDEKFDQIRQEKFPENEERKKAVANRFNLRDIKGGKMARELSLK